MALVGRLLNNYVHFITKQMQEIGDEFWGAENDNSEKLINLPHSISAQTYYKVKGTVASDYTDIEDYYDFQFNYGNFYFLCTSSFTYCNGNISVGPVTKMGRLNINEWNLINADVKNLADDILTAYINNHSTIDIVKTSANDIVYNETLDTFYNNYTFTIDGLYTNVKAKYPAYNGDLIQSGIQLRLCFYDLYEYDGSYYNDWSQVGICPPEVFYAQSKGATMITKTNNQTVIDNIINNSGSTHNYTNTYVSENGDTITTYYGDNYIITKANNDAETTYKEYYDALVDIVNQINTDTSEDITVPTYSENKYGPTPPPAPDPDDDIEVEMPLNDAAFGEGLSHYYVTTVGSAVLNDISAAMSTWDIKNTGKDLYRNLLSCRITKVGPIPSKSSTFVIYGEELQYNGSPITITRITGNPSMDLGAYEILPKFHDFRDYAPFTKVEMFIPYCGWVSLPSHCMSSEENPKIITGTLLCDIIAGTCKAVIKCNDTVVAEASGFTAIDVPFTGENVGMKMAGIASSITSYGNQAAKTVGSVAAGGMSGGAGAGAALAGGIVGMLGSYAQMYSAFNANYTEICGKTGDGCNVAGLGSVYIKIQRPKTGGTDEPYYVPDNYAHTTGFMSMKQKQISKCNGLIVCANVDTSGISGATARERAEIKRLLETGIYVNLQEPEPPEP